MTKVKEFTSVIKVPVGPDTMKVNVKIAIAVANLKQIKAQQAALLVAEKIYKTEIQKAMGDKEILLNADGTRACTWIQGADVIKFDVDAFSTKHPKIYQSFQYEKEGSRTFLVK